MPSGGPSMWNLCVNVNSSSGHQNLKFHKKYQRHDMTCVCKQLMKALKTVKWIENDK